MICSLQYFYISVVVFVKNRHMLKSKKKAIVFFETFLIKKSLFGFDMGVRGLLSFINSRHEEYFTPINISDCNVIVGKLQTFKSGSILN